MARTGKPPPRSGRTRTRMAGTRLLRQGLFGGARWRLGLGAALFALSTARRLLGRRAEIVYSGELRPGERLVVTHLPERHR